MSFFVIFAPMKPWKNIVIVLFVTVVLHACSKLQVQSCFQEDLLYRVESFYQQYPDSAKHILDTLTINVLPEKERAHYCLLKAKVRDGLFIYDDETDSLLQEAQKYFVGSREYYFAAETCEALSRVGFKRGEGYAHKIDWLQKGLESIEQCEHVDQRLLLYRKNSITERQLIDNLKYRIVWRLGMDYSSNEKDLGFDYLKQACRYYTETRQLPMLTKTAYTLGGRYLFENEYDSCLKYLNQGLQSAETMGDASECALFHLYMSYYYRQDTTKGKECWENAINECHQGLDLLSDSLFRYKDGLFASLSRCFFELKQYDSCRYYAERQLAFMEEHHFKMVPNNENAEIHYRLYKSCEALGEKDKALYYAGLCLDMRDQLKNEPNDVNLVIQEYENALERQKLESEEQIKRVRLYLLLSLVTLALIVVLWLSYRYRKNKEIENLMLQEALDKLQLAMETNTQHAHNALTNRVLEIYRSGKDNMLAKILKEIDTTFPAMTEKAKLTYPELTETERNILMLNFVQLRAKEEAEILRLSENTVMKYRSKVRKKAGDNPFPKLLEP